MLHLIALSKFFFFALTSGTVDALTAATLQDMVAVVLEAVKLVRSPFLAEVMDVMVVTKVGGFVVLVVVVV